MAATLSTLAPSEAKALARDAYVFGLPVVYISLYIETFTNVSRPDRGRAPINQFAHHRRGPAASCRQGVGVSVDTSCSSAKLDLTQEPIVLYVPPMGNRYWIMQLYDAWNNVPHAPGWRTAGGTGGTFAIIGPDWDGALPAGVTGLRVPTKFVNVAGRTYIGGAGDDSAVQAIQDRYRLVPLSAWGTRYTPPDHVPVKPGVDSKTTVPRQVLAMSPEVFFSRLNDSAVGNRPEPDDPDMMDRLGRLGIAPGERFRIDAFDPAVRTAIGEGIVAGQQAIRAQQPKLGEPVNGWTLARDLGRYGTRYLYRAAWTFFGLGGNLVEDAVYALTEVDGDGAPYDAAHSYVLRFSKDRLPPVNAFWSVTMYDLDSYLVPNPINRYAAGDRSGLKYHDDGSLTIYIQRDSPGPGRAANWLPAPIEGGFMLALRLYAPKKEVADGGWVPPPVRRVAR